VRRSVGSAAWALTGLLGFAPPDPVVIPFGNDERDQPALARNLERLAGVSRSRRIHVVLVPEPNPIGNDGSTAKLESRPRGHTRGRKAAA
jgi:hypothetical protein